MKLNTKPGRYVNQSPRNRLLRVLTVLLCLSAALFAVVLCMTISAQREFERMADHARLAATAPSVTAASLPPVTQPAPTRETAATEAPAPSEPPTEPPTEPPEPLDEYAGFYEENPDFFGWIRIPETKIDYPVMYSPDEPERYLHADFKGQYSFQGTPFVDALCSPDSDNLLIYAHNMMNGSMFKSLINYQQKDYWARHPLITFDTLYEKHEYEVLAAFYDRVYYSRENVFKFYNFIDAKDPEDFDDAVKNFKEKSIYDTGVSASYGDKLITLVTCAYHTDNGRFVVVARQKPEA